MITFGKGNLRVPKWSRPVYVVAGGCTPFKKFYPEYKLEELCMITRSIARATGLPILADGDTGYGEENPDIAPEDLVLLPEDIPAAAEPGTVLLAEEALKEQEKEGQNGA